MDRQQQRPLQNWWRLSLTVKPMLNTQLRHACHTPLRLIQLRLGAATDWCWRPLQH